MSTSSPFWWEAWPSPPEIRAPKSPPLRRLRSPTTTRGAPGFARRCARAMRRTSRTRRSVAFRRQRGLGRCLRTGCHVTWSGPEAGSGIPWRRRPAVGVPTARERRGRSGGHERRDRAARRPAGAGTRVDARGAESPAAGGWADEARDVGFAVGTGTGWDRKPTSLTNNEMRINSGAAAAKRLSVFDLELMPPSRIRARMARLRACATGLTPQPVRPSQRPLPSPPRDRVADDASAHPCTTAARRPEVRIDARKPANAVRGRHERAFPRAPA